MFSRKIMLIIMAALLAGCDGLQMTNRTPPPLPDPTATQPSGVAAYMAGLSVRAADRDSEDLSALAMQYLQKYADSQEKIVRLQQENRELAERQQKMLEAVARLQAELATSQGQLKDANAVLMEMRGDLEKWKASVMGFRGEMRDAQQAQIVALTRILRLLGGESVAATQPAAPATPAPAASPATPEPAALSAKANTHEGHR